MLYFTNKNPPSRVRVNSYSVPCADIFGIFPEIAPRHGAIITFLLTVTDRRPSRCRAANTEAVRLLLLTSLITKRFTSQLSLHYNSIQANTETKQQNSEDTTSHHHTTVSWVSSPGTVSRGGLSTWWWRLHQPDCSHHGLLSAIATTQQF